jgi:hypothetical protein
VAAARRERETDPVLPIIERCVSEARAAGPGAAELESRLSALLDFVRRFDRGVEFFVRGDARSIERLFLAMDGLDMATVDRLWDLARDLEPAEVASALTALAKLPPAAVRRLVGLADQPVLLKLLGLR